MDLHLRCWEEFRGLWYPCLLQETTRQERLRRHQMRGLLGKRGPSQTEARFQESSAFCHLLLPTLPPSSRGTGLLLAVNFHRSHGCDQVSLSVLITLLDYLLPPSHEVGGKKSPREGASLVLRYMGT